MAKKKFSPSKVILLGLIMSMSYGVGILSIGLKSFEIIWSALFGLIVGVILGLHQKKRNKKRVKIKYKIK